LSRWDLKNLEKTDFLLGIVFSSKLSSTTETQNSRLMQMKADSGYKSLETQHPPPPNGAVKRNHSAGEVEPYYIYEYFGCNNVFAHPSSESHPSVFCLLLE
jgi:hypothetical protein